MLAPTRSLVLPSAWKRRAAIAAAAPHQTSPPAAARPATASAKPKPRPATASAKPRSPARPATAPAPDSPTEASCPPTVLCRPENGLNDMLNQVEICRQYAAQHGRRLVVDTETSRTSCMPVPFAAVFELTDCGCEVATRLTPALCASLNAAGTSVHPPLLTRSFARRAYLPARPAVGAALRVNPEAADRKERVVVHWTGGGGSASLSLLSHRRLRLSQPFVDLFAGGWRKLRRAVQEASPYVAIHVRHTDYTTPDYAKQMAAIFADGGSAPILVCSDGRGVLMEAARLAKVHNRRLLRAWSMEGVAHEPTRADGRPIHEAAARMNSRQVLRYMMDLLRDMYLLTHADQLHALTPARKKAPTGFGRLTRFLHKNPELRASFFREGSENEGRAEQGDGEQAEGELGEGELGEGELGDGEVQTNAVESEPKDHADLAADHLDMRPDVDDGLRGAEE
jgi:hypothetical protein